MPSPKVKYFFYSGILVISTPPSNIEIAGQQASPGTMQQQLISKAYCSKSGLFEPEEVKKQFPVMPGQTVDFIPTNFKQIDKAQYKAFQPKPTNEEKKAGN